MCLLWNVLIQNILFLICCIVSITQKGVDIEKNKIKHAPSLKIDLKTDEHSLIL